ncbi:putative long-chain fatty acid outer membrane transporter [Nitrospira sp. KM1]|uniref:OmpP1/FadL family transporter n=1 Tax=Nitrospira sp. KM1 TaxID=1936990 RepID=UPI0013A79368|nr:outer membrane protein transport protein [Nitrospira sp. KM1]BCA55735.1 putative long-chain fatty acid outer membrane transporter [Nitrospira sp. KM1]
MNGRGWQAGLLLLVLIHPHPASGQALRFQPQSASAAGQGNAFSAQADDPSAIHYNPAGLTQVEGMQAMFGTVLLGGSVKYNSPGGVDTRGDFGGSVVFPPPSHTYFSANLGSLGAKTLSAFTVGLGLTSPYGLSTRYPVDGPFNTAVTSAALPMIDIKPTLAYKLNEDLSFGIGADIYTFAGFLGEGHAEQRQIWPGGLGVPAGASLEFSGKGTGAGFVASALYTPLRNPEGRAVASIGLVYHSQASVPLNGSLLVNGGKIADASTTMVLPQIFTGAMAIWPVRTTEREWKLELDVDFVGWKSMRNLDVHLSNGTTIPQPQQWKTVPVVSVGTEYRWRDPSWLTSWEVTMRTGYTYTKNPVPDATFNPAILSLTAHTISLGAGLLCKGAGHFFGVVPCSGESALWPKAVGLDVAYQEWIYESRTVTGNNNPTVNGRYNAFIHLGTVSLQMRY